MTRYPTLKDVARMAGTTASTVSYVLSGKPGRYVSSEMRERVLAAVEEVGYIRSTPASSLHGKKRGVLAVLVPQFSNQYFTQLVASIESVVEKQGYLLSICNTFDDPERERDIIVKTAEQRVDGYVMIPTLAGARNTASIRRVGVPLVTVDRPLNGASGDHATVSPDNYGCGRVLGEHLARKGHTDVAFIGWESGFRTLDERRVGFWDGMAAILGYTPDELSVTSEFSPAGGYRAAADVVGAHPEITALCLGFNVPAKGSVDYLDEQGLVPGRDLSVVLIGAPDWATTGRNKFTLVDPNPAELGKRAANVLLATLADPTQPPSQQQVVEYQFREGRSVKDIGSPTKGTR